MMSMSVVTDGVCVRRGERKSNEGKEMRRRRRKGR